MIEPTLEAMEPRDCVRVINDVAASHATASWPDGGIAVLHHDDVERLAHDPALAGVGLTLFDLMGIDDGPLRRWYGSLMFTTEGPAHARLRRLVSRAFTPRSVERLRAETARMVAEAYDELVTRGGGDLVATLRTVPMRVMCSMLGVPGRYFDSFVEWANALSPTFGMMTDEQIAAASAAVTELLACVGEMIEERASYDAGDGGASADLLSALLEAEDDGDRLTRAETIDMVANLLVGGHDTTGSQVGCSLLALLRDEAAMASLRGDPDLAPSATWETMRIEPSIIAIPRLSTEPVEVGGVERPAGTFFLLMLASANRDATIWAEADRLVADRFISADTPKPLSFGTGLHFCLGSHMARMTLDEVIAGLATHPLALADDAADVEWRQVLGRSPVAVDVVVESHLG
jgi:cytochrome P450